MGHRSWAAASALLLLAGCLGAQPLPASPPVPAARPFGDLRVFAALPADPGQPGGIVVRDGVVTVDSFGFADRPLGPDALFAYDLATGRPTQGRPNPLEVPRARPASTMGLAGLATDAAGRLYVVDMNGRVLRVDPATGREEVYATFPLSVGAPQTTMPEDIAFDAAGNAYVTDISGVPVVWRIPPGGGVARPWLTDPRLGGWYTEGAGGLRFDPTGAWLYVTVNGSTSPGTAAKGVLLRVRVADPRNVEVVRTYPSIADEPPIGAGALGLAFGASGRLYVALPGASAVSVVAPDGSEAARLGTGNFTPNFVAFDGRGGLLVTAWDFVHDGPWPILDLQVDDTAAPLAEPSLP